MKHHYNGWEAWIVSGNVEAMKFIGLKPAKKIKLYNGQLESRLEKFELYRGSKKGGGKPAGNRSREGFMEKRNSGQNKKYGNKR